MTIFIKNVLLPNSTRANLLIEENRIASINPKKADKSDFLIDARDMAAIPGLFNMHTHAAMVLFKGYADDRKLHEWLTKYIFPIEARLKPKDVYFGTMLACAEMIHSGTTCFNDMYFFEEEIARAVEKSGMRAIVSKALSTSSYKEAEARKAIKNLRKYRRVIPALGPHAIYTTSAEVLCSVKALASELSVPIHFHLSETKKEVEDCMREHGMTPVQYLEKLGFLGSNLINAHCVWLDKKEMKILARHNAKAVSCPISNLKLASGIMPLEALIEEGINVMLGTDGSASNNSLNMFETMKIASLLQKYKCDDASVLPANKMFQLATTNAASAISLNAGEIKTGSLADICLLDLRHISMTPCHNLVSNIVFSADPGCVDTVICDGRIIMQNKEIPWEEKVKKRASKIAEQLADEAK